MKIMKKNIKMKLGKINRPILLLILLQIFIHKLFIEPKLIRTNNEYDFKIKNKVKYSKLICKYNNENKYLTNIYLKNKNKDKYTQINLLKKIKFNFKKSYSLQENKKFYLTNKQDYILLLSLIKITIKNNIDFIPLFKYNGIYETKLLFNKNPLNVKNYKSKLDIRKLNDENYITIYAKGTKGTEIGIIHFPFKYMPNSILLNNEPYNKDITTNIELSKDGVNEIKMSWDNKLDTCVNMFSECDKLFSIDMSHFDASLVTDMTFMFLKCNALTNIDFSNFNTSSVTLMSRMFTLCTSLISLDLSSFNTSKVIHISEMFKSCSSLKYLDISNFCAS